MKRIDDTKAGWINNIMLAGCILTFFSYVIGKAYLTVIGVGCLVVGVIAGLFLFRCPHCGMPFLGLSHMKLEPFACKKCGKTVEFTVNKEQNN